MTAMTTPTSQWVRCVQMWADCPACGRRCLWVGRVVSENGGTAWTIDCACLPRVI